MEEAKSSKNLKCKRSWECYYVSPLQGYSKNFFVQVFLTVQWHSVIYTPS